MARTDSTAIFVPYVRLGSNLAPLSAITASGFPHRIDEIVVVVRLVGFAGFHKIRVQLMASDGTEIQSMEDHRECPVGEVGFRMELRDVVLATGGDYVLELLVDDESWVKTGFVAK